MEHAPSRSEKSSFAAWIRLAHHVGVAAEAEPPRCLFGKARVLSAAVRDGAGAGTLEWVQRLHEKNVKASEPRCVPRNPFSYATHSVAWYGFCGGIK